MVGSPQTPTVFAPLDTIPADTSHKASPDLTPTHEQAMPSSDTPTPAPANSAATNPETTTPVTDVVFDFCGVLVDWQSRAALEGHYAPEIVDEICADDDPRGFFHYEDLMDGGTLLSEVLPVIAAEQGQMYADIYEDYINRYGEALPRMVPGSLQLLEDLNAAGIRVWGLTNWSSETFHFAFERFPELKAELKDTVVSGVEHMHKPNADIYELALSRFGIAPESAVFIDDTAKNVAGAEAVGMRGIRFESAQQARKALRELGVQI